MSISKISEEATYTVDDVVNKSGYGKFQIRLLILAGIGWIADSCEVFILSFLGHFLACDWTIYTQQLAILTYSMFLGVAIGSYLLGTIADIFGRKKALAASVIILFIFGFANAFVPSFLWMVICRGIIGFALGGVKQGLTLCTEYCPANMRGKAGFYLCYFWAFGTTLVILVAWVVMQYLNSWRVLLAVLSLPCLAVIISLNWYPESARYYLVSNQYDKAVKILKSLAKLNGTILPPGHLVQVKSTEKRGRLMDLLNKEYRLSTVLVWYIWLASGFCTYGISFVSPIIIQRGYLRAIEDENNTSTNHSENSLNIVPCKEFTQTNFINLLWTNLSEFPGAFIYTFLAERCGRKFLLSSSCVVTAILMLLLLVKNTTLSLIILFVTRGITFSIFMMVGIVTLELYPTTFRAVAIGFGNLFCKVGGFMIPYVAQVLVYRNPSATMGIMALVIFLAAITSVCLPSETRGVKMKDTTYEDNAT